MSNISFSHSVFERLILQTRENQGLFGKGLTCIFCAIGNYYFNITGIPTELLNDVEDSNTNEQEEQNDQTDPTLDIDDKNVLEDFPMNLDGMFVLP